jgi:hypothetical protein
MVEKEVQPVGYVRGSQFVMRKIKPSLPVGIARVEKAAARRADWPD